MKYIDKILKEMPVGLERAILSTLKFHVGLENAIPRLELLAEIKKMGFDVDERTLRAQIRLLKDDCHTICAVSKKGGGYYLALDWDELNEYIEREIESRAMDLLSQKTYLRIGAKRQWGVDAPQMELL